MVDLVSVHLIFEVLCYRFLSLLFNESCLLKPLQSVLELIYPYLCGLCLPLHKGFGISQISKIFLKNHQFSAIEVKVMSKLFKLPLLKHGWKSCLKKVHHLLK